MGVYEGIDVYDAAYAAEVVMKLDLRRAGAIASGHAGYLYGLDLLEVWMSDDGDHSKLYSIDMPFLMLAREAMTPPADGPIKTTFAIGDNRMGREVSYHGGKHTFKTKTPLPTIVGELKHVLGYNCVCYGLGDIN
ncbi:hypothetical protein SLA2020_365030 [Shorea laevis]